MGDPEEEDYRHGEAEVDSVDRGEGDNAYYVLCKWFQGATGVSIQDLRTKLMAPNMAKKETIH